jgi:hypothetical protein
MSTFGVPVSWRKSSFSQNGDCVEVACAGTSIFVRDSEPHSDAVLEFGTLDWKRFIATVRSKGAI